ncbi:MAG: 3-isopropylmalate dehydratase small subunit [Acidobacteria bacterium RIFCSPLOWO2_12_FULL_67_14b]|nr:MAG: 3-isopropylmalate dehydratase small subunit [Acidobacteria bacterium RIFCSPLOWO2_12_FULL_67_14b]
MSAPSTALGTGREPFRTHRGRVAPLGRSHVDTDQIIPKQFLKRIERTGFGPFLFYDWRRTPDGQLDPSFVLNQPQYAGTTVLAAGPNFGCGSSREHAAWSLADAGFRVVIAPSFADIFRLNCIGNGLLPVTLPDAAVAAILDRAGAGDGYEVDVDLEQREVRDAHGLRESFTIDAASRQRLLEGKDEIDLILAHEPDIAAFERQRVIT